MSLGGGEGGGRGEVGFAGTTGNHHLLLAYVAWTTGHLLRFNVATHLNSGIVFDRMWELASLTTGECSGDRRLGYEGSRCLVCTLTIF